MNFRHQWAKKKYFEPAQNDVIKFIADLYIKLDWNVANNAVTNAIQMDMIIPKYDFQFFIACKMDEFNLIAAITEQKLVHYLQIHSHTHTLHQIISLS